MKNILITILTFYFLISTSFVHSVSETIKQIKIKIGRLGDLNALIPILQTTTDAQPFVKTKVGIYHRTLNDIRSLEYYVDAWY